MCFGALHIDEIDFRKPNVGIHVKQLVELAHLSWKKTVQLSMMHVSRHMYKSLAPHRDIYTYRRNPYPHVNIKYKLTLKNNTVSILADLNCHH